MTTVLQFTSIIPSAVIVVETAITDILNDISLLQWRAQNNIDYVTAPFSVSMWQKHTTNLTLYWCDYTSVYANVGITGSRIANRLFGTQASPGLLTSSILPGLTLQVSVKDIADLVASGYMAAPQSQI